MLSRLPITLDQLKAGNNCEKLKNENRQLLASQLIFRCFVFLFSLLLFFSYCCFQLFSLFYFILLFYFVLILVCFFPGFLLCLLCLSLFLQLFQLFFLIAASGREGFVFSSFCLICFFFYFSFVGGKVILIPQWVGGGIHLLLAGV